MVQIQNLNQYIILLQLITESDWQSALTLLFTLRSSPILYSVQLLIATLFYIWTEVTGYDMNTKSTYNRCIL